jgi:glycosyltransferase involved in cell wall biosynthesis
VRVLYLVSTLTGGGAERQTEHLCSAMMERGHDVLVGYVHEGAGKWPRAIPTHRFAARNAWHPALLIDIVSLIFRWNPDVMQTSLPQMDVAGGLAAALTGIPVALREASTADSYARAVKARLRVWTARLARASVVANSDEGAAYWIAQAPLLRRKVITNAVPVGAIEAVEPFGRSDGRSVAVFVGRLVAEKNVDTLLRAAAIVMAERPLDLYLCGDGVDREKLIALAASLGIAAHVHFTGFVSDVWRYVRGADVTLLLSAFEGQPNAVLESFAAGAPAILSDIPAHRQLAADDAALLVPVGDVSATAAAIRQTLDDRTSALARARRARLKVDASPVTAVAAEYERVYAELARRVVRRGLRWKRYTPELD